MAGRIPQNFINDLVARADIVALIEDRIKLRKAGKNYQGLCPFHDEKSPSFSVSPDKQFYHCFGCGVSGTALTFLMEYDRLEFVPAVEVLAAMVGVEVVREGGSAARPPAEGADLYAILERAAALFRRHLQQQSSAVDYLKGRRLTGVIARDYSLGFAPDAWDTMTTALDGVSSDDLLRAGLLTENDSGRCYDRFRGRIMFPIRDTRGKVIGFGGRVLGSGEPKYLNSPETEVFHKGRELYGLFEARQALRKIDEFFVVEGYMDVIALAQAGINNAVATLGTASSQVHFDKLYRYVARVTCCFDGDNAGRQAAWKALRSALPTLRDGRQLRFMFVPDGEDPDSLVNAEGRDGFLARAEGAVSALDYLFDTLQRGLDLSSLDGRARLAHLATPLVELVPAGLLRELLESRLTQMVGMSPWGQSAGLPGKMGPDYSSAQTEFAGNAVTSAVPRSAPVKESALGKHLLTLFLRYPEIARELDQSQIDRLRGVGGLPWELVKYLVESTEADVGLADVLGYWVGQPEERILVELSRRAVELPLEAARQDCLDGIERLVRQHGKRSRQRLLRELRDQQGTDDEAQALRQYWQQRQDSGPKRNP